MTAIAGLVAMDRGLIDPEAPVAKYWPEFAQNGKEKVLVKHLFGHASGLAGWDDDVTWDDVYDLEYSIGLLEKQKPWWEPGTASGYHGISMGHPVSGLLKRVTGKTLGQYFKDDIADPLGADFHIGTGPEHDHRVAPFVQAIPDVEPPANWIAQRVGHFPDLNPANSSSLPFRRAEIGGVNGHGNARAVATIKFDSRHRRSKRREAVVESRPRARVGNANSRHGPHDGDTGSLGNGLRSRIASLW